MIIDFTYILHDFKYIPVCLPEKYFEDSYLKSIVLAKYYFLYPLA